ncbi:covalently-linked cell wall protein 14-like [Varroa destructor]|uniref:Chitin-binding type-2 domain-containing protein n=1 Tax=Varroa destructor TaxID=109461 RepID=A0A7M7J498_VARDE|nr:covalently-linked cell wall protein 14-like [Varroa destructor]
MKAFIVVGCLIAVLALGAQAKPFAFGPGRSDCPSKIVLGMPHYVPDPNDCTKYSVCNFWFSAKFVCKYGDHFSVTEQRCVRPWLAGCDPAYKTTILPPITGTQKSSIATPIETSSVETEATKPNVLICVEAAKVISSKTKTSSEKTEVAETDAPTSTEAAEATSAGTEAAETDAPTSTESVETTSVETESAETNAPSSTEAAEATSAETEAAETDAPTSTESVETTSVETELPKQMHQFHRSC